MYPSIPLVSSTLFPPKYLDPHHTLLVQVLRRHLRHRITSRDQTLCDALSEKLKAFLIQIDQKVTFNGIHIKHKTASYLIYGMEEYFHFSTSASPLTVAKNRNWSALKQSALSLSLSPALWYDFTTASFPNNSSPIALYSNSFRTSQSPAFSQPTRCLPKSRNAYHLPPCFNHPTYPIFALLSSPTPSRASLDMFRHDISIVYTSLRGESSTPFTFKAPGKSLSQSFPLQYWFLDTRRSHFSRPLIDYFSVHPTVTCLPSCSTFHSYRLIQRIILHYYNVT